MYLCLIEPYEDVLRTSSGCHQDMMSSGGPRDVILRSGQYTSRLNFATLQYTFLNRSFTYNVRNNFQVEQCCSEKNPYFSQQQLKKSQTWLNVALLWLILKWYTILEDLFLLDSVRYREDVMMTLKSDWFNLKILMSG